MASEAFAATFRCDPNPPAFFAALAGTLFAAQRFFVERRFPPRCYFVPFFAALAARAFARFATSAAFPAGDSFRLATDFLAAAFLATAGRRANRSGTVKADVSPGISLGLYGVTISAPPPGSPRCNSAGALAGDENAARIPSGDRSASAADGAIASADQPLDFRDDL